ncbi:MAG: hypothetical protein BGP16_03980 [Sphingobium sp. 66-54]|nr:MAG: hypothetical protein BGP16_03980 [Sphingobium sp. 66-54]
MSISSDFYLARAADCAREATETRLTNVRDRCLRSEAAWRTMAERVLKTEASKSLQEAEKARIGTAGE